MDDSAKQAAVDRVHTMQRRRGFAGEITHVRVALATVCDCICTIVSGIVIQIVLDVYYVQLYTFSSSGVMTMYKTAWVGRSLDRLFYIYLVVDKMQDVTHTYLFI